MYHVFFIHSSVDGDLGCLHVLAVVNSAAINIRGQASFQIMGFSEYFFRSGIAGSYVNSTFSFSGTSILFSIVAVPNFIPTKSIRGFPFLHIQHLLFVDKQLILKGTRERRS